MKPKKCGNCGSKETALTETQGPFPWRDFPALHLIRPVSLHRCQQCKEFIYLPSDAAKVDDAVEASIREYVRFFIQTIVQREKCSQIILAQRVGVTPEYLSAIKAGSRLPSFQTFNFLKTFTLDEKAFQVADPTSGRDVLRQAAAG